MSVQLRNLQNTSTYLQMNERNRNNKCITRNKTLNINGIEEKRTGPPLHHTCNQLNEQHVSFEVYDVYPSLQLRDYFNCVLAY